MVSSLPMDAHLCLLSLGLGFWGSMPLLTVTEVSFLKIATQFLDTTSGHILFHRGFGLRLGY